MPRGPYTLMLSRTKCGKASTLNGGGKISFAFSNATPPAALFLLAPILGGMAETEHLAGQFPETVQRLAAECAAWQQRCGIVDYAEILKLNPNN